VLSAIRERFVVPEVDPAVLGAARTLGEVAGVLGGAPDTNLAEAAPASSAVIPQRKVASPILRFASRQIPALTSGLETPGLANGPIAVVGGPPGLANQLVAELARSGTDARATNGIGDGLHGVILLGGLEEPNDDLHRSLFLLAKSFARGAKPGMFVVVQDSGRTQDRAWASGLTAFGLTAAQEWPEITVRTLDCNTADLGVADLAGVIADELRTGGSEPEVTLSPNGGRVVRRFDEALSPPTGQVRIGSRSVLVISGGARGITATAVRALAADHAPKAVLLLGRTPLIDEPAHLRGATGEAGIRQAVIERLRGLGQTPEPRRIKAETTTALALREVRETMRILESAGSAVHYRAVDVTQEAAVRAAVGEFREKWGPITGLIHGAGVLADKTIADKPVEDFDRVFATKVDGLRALLTATETDPLEVLCVFSSVAAEFGNTGQSDYATANEVVTRLADAERVRRRDCLVRTIAWGPWTGGMVDEALAAHFRSTGVRLIAEEDGARAFLEELRDDVRPETGAVIRSAGPPSAPPGVSGVVTLSARTHPYLSDHAIAGTPVVPVALALEWFTGAAVASSPGEPVTITGLEVLSKIALPDFATDDTRLLLSTEPVEGGQYRAVLTGTRSRPHYRAMLTAATEPSSGRAWPLPGDLPPLDRVVYDGHLLFHGPAFQALAAVDGLAESGATGTLKGVRELGWPDAPRHTDPAAVDGCMQLAAAWGAYLLGGAVLPMGVGAFRVFQPGAVDGRAVAVVRAVRRVSDTEAVCSIQASRPEGEPLFELTEVKLVLRPDTAATSLPER
jgi:NAD(P)-dependent dehydrogenase (short-subunit alcohol dehydrogenase family)